MIQLLFETLVLVTALSVDSFAAGFAYGISKVRVPLLSLTIITCISSITLILALLLGTVIQGLIPPSLTVKISFTILFLLGLSKLIVRSDHETDAVKANKDGDDLLSPLEALSLGMALSIDSIAAGIGAGVMDFDIPATLIISLLIGAAALLSGRRLGCLISCRFHTNLSWVSGVLLMLLAIMKLL